MYKELEVLENLDIIMKNKEYILSSKWKNLQVPIRLTSIFYHPIVGNTLETMIKLWSDNWKLNDNEYIVYTVGSISGTNFNDTYVYMKNENKIDKRHSNISWKSYAKRAEDFHRDIDSRNEPTISFDEFPKLLDILKKGV